MTFIEYSWLIPLLPLLGFVFILVQSRLAKAPEYSGYIAIVAVGLAFLLSIGTIYEAAGREYDGGSIEEGSNQGVYLKDKTWFKVGDHEFTYGIYVDHLTALMLLVVSLVSFLVVIYSLGYMAHEGRRRTRYYAEIALFVGVMLGLVLASNFLMLFIFWELVGVCSYLLIGFWYEKPEAASAAKKAFIVTRAGDISFLIGLIILWNTFRSFDFDYLFNTANLADHASELKWATLFIFGGAVGKSAQFPLHVWLPDAMEGPTTVSALIHAATMVKAGVYLVARAYPIFVQSPDTMLVVAVIGGFTAFLAATMALVMYDIKRVLAYSTISQLGYMFLALGAGGYFYYHHPSTHEVAGYTAGMFHLMNHAFFKALLFLGAGSVIHCAATQDMRRMGGLAKVMPVTSAMMLLGVLSIAGFPGFSGFWSKDEILAAVFETGADNPIFYLLWALGLLTALMTAFYMARLWFMTFSGTWRGDPDHKAHLHESPRVMTAPLRLLGLLAVGSGVLALFLGPLLTGIDIGLEPASFASYLRHPQGGELVHVTANEIFYHTLESPLTWLSVAAAVAGLTAGYLFYRRGPAESDQPHLDPAVFTATQGRRAIHLFLTNRLYMSDLFNWVGLRFFTHVAAAADWFDRKVIDGMVNGLGRGGIGGGQHLRRLQSGVVSSYASMILGGLLLLILALKVALPVLGWSP